MSPRRSLISAVAVSAVAVATVLAVAPNSTAAVQQVAVGSTVNGVLGGLTFIGKPTTLGLTLTNNSTTKAKLGLFTIQVPAGVGPVALGAVSPSTWKETKLGCGRTPNCSALILVAPKTPLASALIPVGGTVTAFLSFTPPAAGTFTFPILGIGLGNGIYTASGSVTVSAAAALKITSITDNSTLPPLTEAIVNKPFTVAFQAVDSTNNPVSQPGLVVTLTGNPAGGFSAASTGTTNSSGAGTIVATDSVIQTGLQLTVASPPLTPDTASTNVISSGDSAPAGTGDISLMVGTANADLPRGSFSPVSLIQTPCTAVATDTDPGCGGATIEVTLAGTFSGTRNDVFTHLYTNEAPGTIDWVCPVATCPHPDLSDEPSGESYSENEDEPGDSEQIGDFDAYNQLSGSILHDGVYKDWTTLPSCRDLNDPEQFGLTGAIVTEEAQTAGICVDVYAISRTGDSFGGDLIRPVLFAEDPKLRGP